MAKLTAKLLSGEAFDIEDLDLEHQTPKQLIEELITNGALQPEDTLPATADGRHSVYGIVDKNNVKIQPDSDQTFSQLGFIDGDTVRIIILAPGASGIYEIRLKKEFELLQRLQRHPNTRGIIDIYYKERVGSRGYKPIVDNPSTNLYPNSFKVTYTFPIMYVGRGQVKTNWSHSFTLEVPEYILMDPDKTVGNEFEIEGGCFPSGNVPFNSHISPNWVCIGALWQVANQGFGIWYFFVSLGALLNQEKTEMDPNDTVHLNGDAFDYWMEDRQMQPNNIINWPYNLDKDINIVPGRHVEPVPTERRGMKIIPRITSASSASVDSEPKRPMKITKRINPDE